MDVIIVDGDTSHCETLRAHLEGEGFSVVAVHDGERGLDAIRRNRFDIMVLDVVLPRMGGLQLLRQVRADHSLPILILSARAEDVDRIVGLELGADDYVAKPCNPRELSARLRAIGRRTQSPVETVSVNGVSLRSVSRSVTCDGQPIAVTTVEFDLLDKLIRAAGRVVTRHELTGTREGDPLNPLDRSVDMHISRLRRKLGSLGRSSRIKTIHGVGYQFLYADPADTPGNAPPPAAPGPPDHTSPIRSATRGGMSGTPS